ncbi:hypothetical protein D3C81_2182530 [compost metagenome]
MNFEQALTNASGVFFSPKPYTFTPSVSRRITSGVKSASLETIAKPSRLRAYSMSIASITIAMSDAFLPRL